MSTNNELLRSLLKIRKILDKLGLPLGRKGGPLYHALNRYVSRVKIR